MYTYSGSPGQQCCYDNMGNLVIGSRSGGSVNRFASVDLDSFHKHIQHDVIPKVYCCPGACRGYYRKRPSDDGKNYRPPPPGMIYTMWLCSDLKLHVLSILST